MGDTALSSEIAGLSTAHIKIEEALRRFCQCIASLQRSPSTGCVATVYCAAQGKCFSRSDMMKPPVVPHVQAFYRLFTSSINRFTSSGDHAHSPICTAGPVLLSQGTCSALACLSLVLQLFELLLLPMSDGSIV